MSFTNAAETALLQLLFENQDLGTPGGGIELGDTASLQGSATAGSVFIALFTADPGEAGSTSNEADYTGYARVAVARSSAEWTVTGNNCVNDNAVTFPAATGGSNTITHWAIMTALTGGQMLAHAAVDTSRAVTDGVTPEFGAGDLSLTLD